MSSAGPINTLYNTEMGKLCPQITCSYCSVRAVQEFTILQLYTLPVKKVNVLSKRQT